ncbi:hypothetical protein GUITHDRAFT_142462 [Guillardia theta CCMP2712]|uniref:EGF-like domain-containing protein n=1 Tax=Guillardia theta (strain CCMP2712) TaxID=905079 RepID=L1IXN7_GUITC|nr:hypothetical protein GUITHDRAFT_142462 [Guillardia theta CCMP2712]EKX40842.1 hypothetical protein GUITHDRAFT_142462 [Guillardia theta CCMP2712]|eukprot:XP_005827822.1 hypothetical protein GUITHDRAFT_142462 [Guillardia theta CCMP2712]
MALVWAVMAAALALAGNAGGADASGGTFLIPSAERKLLAAQDGISNCSAACARCNMFGSTLDVPCSSKICNSKGRCDGQGRCVCFEGWAGLTCNVSTTTSPEVHQQTSTTIIITDTNATMLPGTTVLPETTSAQNLTNITGENSLQESTRTYDNITSVVSSMESTNPASTPETTPVGNSAIEATVNFLVTFSMTRAEFENIRVKYLASFARAAKVSLNRVRIVEVREISLRRSAIHRRLLASGVEVVTEVKLDGTQSADSYSISSDGLNAELVKDGLPASQGVKKVTSPSTTVVKSLGGITRSEIILASCLGGVTLLGLVVGCFVWVWINGGRKKKLEETKMYPIA